ncbi:MAG TPA: hypothetical protein VKY15_00060 [Acidimicrobiales bacterium]|jgi:hypothetical protein|nr:hypothetical protein [Acidimicrobiales bacterium]
MARVQLRQLCGARSGDKGDVSDLSLFCDTPEAYEALRRVVTAEAVKEHFGYLVKGRVERYEVPNVLALKFVMHEALGGGGPASLRSDNLGKTYGGSLLRMWVEVPDEVAAAARRRRAPLERPAAPAQDEAPAGGG